MDTIKVEDKSLDKGVEHKNIYSALSAFQGEMKPIEQSETVDFNTKDGRNINFSYAPLGKIVEVINPILSKHGLSFRHEITKDSIECFLTHQTSRTENKNELSSGKLPIDLTKADMKEVGGQITYGRRYTLGLVLGLATEEDKDTELMDSSRKSTSNFAYNQVKKTVEKAKGEQLETQITFLKENLDLATKLKNGEGKEAPTLDLTVSQYQELLDFAEGIKKGEKVVNVDK